FSSRRRHTRFSRDWSSDVCSSDLSAARDSQTVAVNVGDGLTVSGGAVVVDSGIARKKAFTVGGNAEITVTHDLGTEDVQVEVFRSEERRVGKEARARRSAYPSKQL